MTLDCDAQQESELIEYLTKVKAKYAPRQIIGSGGNINTLFKFRCPDPCQFMWFKTLGKSGDVLMVSGCIKSGIS